MSNAETCIYFPADMLCVVWTVLARVSMEEYTQLKTSNPSSKANYCVYAYIQTHITINKQLLIG